MLAGRLLGSWLLPRIKPDKLLAGFSFTAAAFVLISIIVRGQSAIWPIVLCGFCNSIMFPNIFALGIAGLGPMISKGSRLMMTAIVAGAVISYLLGALADRGGIQKSFFLAVLYYPYIAHYGVRGSKLAAPLRSQKT
jgi:MFS transporter, FHS family, L-fucose permease